MTVGLIDGDIVAYRSAAAAQDDFNGDIMVDRDKAFQGVDLICRTWLNGARCSKGVVCLSPRDSSGNFRKQLFPQYKAHRKGEKPKLYWDMVDWLHDQFKVVTLEGAEADDALGILGTERKDHVVVSLDKDIMTLPCRVFVPGKMRRPIKLTRGQADWHWMMQTLTGDSTDGYKGCPGIGPKRAEKILDGQRPLDDLWNRVVKAFESRDLTADDALIQAQLARILRSEDYDRNKREINLWKPK